MTRRARGVAATLLGTIVSAAVLTGCGSASEEYAPTGVDQLVIPTPSLAPDDFVAGVDNPWLPLTPGSRWTYDRIVDGAHGRLEVEVLDRTREIQGVDATVVRTSVVSPRQRVVAQSFRWYAQDAAGNVWFLGEQTTSYAGKRPSTEGSWEAGVAGAEAGLAMPATPRIGDGFRTDYAPGVAEDRAEVVDLSGFASVPYGDLTDLLETEDRTAIEPDVLQRRQYAKGIGLVRELTITGGDQLLELVSYRP
ncbi:hypothetical protein F0U44_02410 [Nocardioides humilatus]|uniref:Lipoprotein n=1 Tax=Nocardioides humilatus TaxID=2607660 RepID=A0A5B1LL39_9ACTN|nr:hypothetical protein [Nocardioides humilatus]KAA1421184.1 hypothetical protein F0U44_02410 [Nocardioides humilatus]